MFNIFIVFAFVALWHGDFNVSLILWALIMSIAILPELMVKYCYRNIKKIEMFNKIKNNMKQSVNQYNANNNY